MDRVGSGSPGGVDHQVGPQVGVAGGVARQANRPVGFGHVGGTLIGVGVDGHGVDAQVPTGAEHPPGDLAPVGHQHRGDRVGSLCVAHRSPSYIRNTPKPSAPRTGPEWMADRAMPNTVRVSRGSMIPSSSIRPDKNMARDSASI